MKDLPSLILHISLLVEYLPQNLVHKTSLEKTMIEDTSSPPPKFTPAIKTELINFWCSHHYLHNSSLDKKFNINNTVNHSP